MKRLLIILILFSICQTAISQKVSVKANEVPVETVFKDIMDQTGRNFVYSSGVLDGLKVTVDIKDVGLKHALNIIFKNSDIKFKIKGRSILLMKKNPNNKKKEIRAVVDVKPAVKVSDSLPSVMLNEVLVESRLDRYPMDSSEIGAMKLSGDDIAKIPVLMSEEDVMKTFQMQPGIMQVAEGMAGISVHGGDPDQNMLMLDNMPLYSSDHCVGLFSAFNVDAVDHIDFYKSSVPARYDGRLSSYLDVRTKNGSSERRNGSVRLGLAAGAFSINGPIGKNTTYSVSLRRSWTEALTLPLLGIVNLISDDKYYLNLAFTDITGKITHTFRKGTVGFVKVYYGEDWWYGMSTFNDEWDHLSSVTDKKESYGLRWGNLIVQSGLKHQFSEGITAEFTGGYTRFFSSMKENEHTESSYSDGKHGESWFSNKISNNIGDFIFKGDFDWRPDDNHNVSFGAGYILHSFLPERILTRYVKDSVKVTDMDSTWRYIANEVNAYIQDDWRINEKFRINAGLNASIFCIDDKIHSGLSPRISLSYNPASYIALKAAYSRNTQYVHRLSQSYISLPTDQWVPITGGFKPETSDKVVAGAYWLIGDGKFSATIEGYMKRMNNLVDYREEYYLKLPAEKWSSVLCSGKGSARGVDISLEKRSGSVTGHVSYSLAWADRTFADKNGGKTFPARLDHRHTINVLVNWEATPKVNLSAAWIGHSGSRYTLITQVWTGAEEIDRAFWSEQSGLKTELNRYMLPFYHRLDLSCRVKNKRGYWNFSLYNAYCHMNTIGIRRTYNKNGKPVFQKVAILPIIPSFSYTWLF